jgi:biotin transporter BioY
MSIILFIAFAVLVAVIAKNTNRSFWLWLLISLGLSPLLGAVLLGIFYGVSGNLDVKGKPNREKVTEADLLREVGVVVERIEPTIEAPNLTLVPKD